MKSRTRHPRGQPQQGDLLDEPKAMTSRHAPTRAELLARVAELERRASYPRLNPNPVTECDLVGRLTYLNPAATRLFSGLESMGPDHPWLRDFAATVASLRATPAGHQIRTIAVEDRWYQQTLAFVPEYECVRIYGIDVTESENAKQQAARSAAQLKAVLDSVSDGVFAVSAGGNVLFANPAVAELSGLRHEPDGQSLAHYTQVEVHDAAGALVPEADWPVNRALRGERLRETPYHITRPAAGKSYLAVYNATPVFDADGKVAMAVVTSRDISERKRAEEALRESEERLRLLSDNLPDCAVYQYTHEPDDCSRFLYVSQGIERLNGVKPEDVLRDARTLLDQVLPEYVEQLVRLEERSRTSLTDFDLELPMRRPDGELRWMHLHSRPRRLPGGRTVWDGVQVDVTQRKQDAEALRVSEEKFAKAFATSPAAISLTGLEDGLMVDVNETWLAMFGFRRDEVIGRSTKDLSVWPTSDARQRFADELRDKGSFRDREQVVVARNGQRLVTMASAELITIAGKPMVLSTWLDITERKRAEDELREVNTKLQDADHHKNEFLAVLSHELRNPLAPIKNSLYVLDHAAPGGDQARRAHEVILRQVAHLSNLVDDLLDVTRVSRNKIQLQREKLDLNDVVSRAVEDHRSLFLKAGVRLEVALSPTPVIVDADRTRTAQVVGNLLHNAAKFTLPGGRARVSVATDMNDAIVQVADDGVGMTGATVARLFQSFVQADQTLHRSQGGLGLGLALVKGLVDLHGGSVSARSDGIGKGSELTVRLALEPDGSLTPELAPLPRLGPPRRVLIIEDNVDAADTLREALELCGHAVEVAYDGAEGLAKARALGPEIVLCDIGLPGMDGFDVARAIRADPALTGILLVALSGYAQPEDLQHAAEVGFQHHLAKPPDFELLKQILAEVVPSTLRGDEIP